MIVTELKKIVTEEDEARIDPLRRFVSARLTTEEILRAVETQRFLRGARRARLEAVLWPCDYVKFAEGEPTLQERAAILDAAGRFVRAATPADEGRGS